MISQVRQNQEDRTLMWTEFKKAEVAQQAAVLQIQQYQDDRAHIHTEFKKAEVARNQAMQGEVLRWLNSSDNKITYEAACATRQTYPDSGKWLLRDPKVKEWKTETVPVNPVSLFPW